MEIAIEILCNEFLGETGLAVPGPTSMPLDGKKLPAYNDHMMTLASASSQQVRNTGILKEEHSILSPYLNSKTSGPVLVTREVHAAVTNLAKLAEPLAAGDVADWKESTKADSGIAESGVQSEEMNRAESTPATVSSLPSAAVTATDSSATPDVVSTSMVTSQVGQNTTASSDQYTTATVAPVTESYAPVLTAIYTTTAGTTLFGKPLAPTFTAPSQVTTSAGFVFGQPPTSTSSKLFGPPSASSGLEGPPAEQPTVSSSKSESSQPAVISTTSSAVGVSDISTSGDIFCVTSVPSTQPLPVPTTLSSETTVAATSVEHAAVASVGVDSVTNTSAAAMLFGQSVSSGSAVTSVASTTAVHSQPSTTADAGGSTPLLSEPITSSVASTTVVSVFAQPSAAVASSCTATTLFGGSTSTSVTTSVPPPFGIPTTSSSVGIPATTAGVGLFGQQSVSIYTFFCLVMHVRLRLDERGLHFTASVVTFLRCGGQIYNHSSKMFSGFYVPKIITVC